MFMVRKILLAIGLLMFGAAMANAERWSIEAMNETINQTNFIVGGGCSGTLISLKYRLILTNHHCIRSYVNVVTRDKVVDGVVKKVRIEELRDVQVSQRSYANYRKVGSASWQSVIVARWKESDLALIQIRAENIPHKIQSNVFAGKKVYRGEEVYAVGNPSRLDASITRGIISSTNRMFRAPWANNTEVPFIQIDATIAGGSSGGALYNDGGELIGVPAAGIGQIGMAIPFFRIQELLTKNCYRVVWDKGEGVKDHDACMKARKDDKKKKADQKEDSSSGRTVTDELTLPDTGQARLNSTIDNPQCRINVARLVKPAPTAKILAAPLAPDFFWGWHSMLGPVTTRACAVESDE